MNTFWTWEREELLTELWEGGCTRREIGDSLGTTRNAVISKARRMRLKFQPPSVRADPPEPSEPLDKNAILARATAAGGWHKRGLAAL